MCSDYFEASHKLEIIHEYFSRFSPEDEIDERSEHAVVEKMVEEELYADTPSECDKVVM